MAWVKIDDQFPEHQKVAQAGPLAMAMQVAALCYANRNLTDGFIPARAAASLLPTVCFDPETGEPTTWRDAAAALVRAGMWEEADGGYLIHDYDQYQPSRAQVEAEREAARERMAELRAKRRRDKEQRSEDVRPNNSGTSLCPVPDPVTVVVEEDARTREAETDEGFKLVHATYEQQIGINGPDSFRRIDAYLGDGFEPRMMVAVIEWAADRKRRGFVRGDTWTYAAGTLDNCRSDEVFTLEQWQAAQERFESQKAKAPRARAPDTPVLYNGRKQQYV